MPKLKTISGRADGTRPFVENVGVDHGRFEVTVAKEFLDGSDIVTTVEELRGEGVPKGVARHSFLDS